MGAKKRISTEREREKEREKERANVVRVWKKRKVGLLNFISICT